MNKREKILEFIIVYMQKHGYSPSYDEIKDGVGLKSKIQCIDTDTEGSPRALRVPGYKYVKKNTMNKINQITAEMAEHVCDELCKYPQKASDEETAQEELEEICSECKLGQYICDILNNCQEGNHG